MFLTEFSTNTPQSSPSTRQDRVRDLSVSKKRMVLEAIAGWSGRRRHSLDALDDSHVQIVSTLVDSLEDLVHDLWCAPRCEDTAGSRDHGSSDVCNDPKTHADEDLL